jgi:hypothetical protein
MNIMGGVWYVPLSGRQETTVKQVSEENVLVMQHRAGAVTVAAISPEVI